MSEINSRLKKLSKCQPMIDGSLCQVGRTCGKPNCHCASGEKHLVYNLSKKVRGKTKSTYIPKDMAEEVSTWIKEHSRIKKLMKEITERSEEILRLRKKSRAANKKNDPPTEK